MNIKNVYELDDMTKEVGLLVNTATIQVQGKDEKLIPLTAIQAIRRLPNKQMLCKVLSPGPATNAEFMATGEIPVLV